MGNGQSRKAGKMTGTLHVEAGAYVEGGKIAVIQGCGLKLEGSADRPVVLKNVQITCDCNATVDAVFTVFDGCSFAKGSDVTVTAGYSSHWIFSDCLLRGSKFNELHWSRVGVDFERCAFVDCTLGERTWSRKAVPPPEVGAVALERWNTVSQCNFYHCSLVASDVWMTKACNFTDCLVSDPATFMGKTNLIVHLGVSGDDPLIAQLRSKTYADGSGTVKYLTQPPHANAIAFDR